MFIFLSIFLFLNIFSRKIKLPNHTKIKIHENSKKISKKKPPIKTTENKKINTPEKKIEYKTDPKSHNPKINVFANKDFFTEKPNKDSFDSLINEVFAEVSAGKKLEIKQIENYIDNKFSNKINNYFEQNKIEFILSNDEVVEISDFLNNKFFPNLGILQPCILVPIAIFLANIYKKEKKINKINEFFNLLRNKKEFPIFYNFENFKDQVPVRDLWQKTITEIIKKNNNMISDELLWELSTEYASFFEKNSIKIIRQITLKSKDFFELEKFEKNLKDKKSSIIVLFNLGKLNKRFNLNNYLKLSQKERKNLQLQNAAVETGEGHYTFFNGKSFINPLGRKNTKFEISISKLRDFYFNDKIFEIISEIPLSDEIIKLFTLYGKYI